MRAVSPRSNRPFSIEPLEKRELLASTFADLPDNQHLTKKDVSNILAAAASQALPSQIISVTDRDGQILGIVAMNQAKVGSNPLDQSGIPNPLLSTLVKSITRSRTAAFFESHEDAFTTRTARFIIQDHFPFPLPNTSGGPLYGVEFSSLPGSDVYSGPAISGDPGGIPLFKDGVPVGGIGVAGDGKDTLVRPDFFYDPHVTATDNVYDGSEEHDIDEQVALAGATKFMAPKAIQAEKIFVAGLRFPFTADKPATGNAARTLDDITTSGDGTLIVASKKAVGFSIQNKPYVGQSTQAPRSSPGSPYPAATIAGVTGEFKNTNPHATDFGLLASNDKDESGTLLDVKDRLTKNDVQKIITQAVNEAVTIRGGIRLPLGVALRVHIAVVDRDGDILGVFRMQDGTNFSFDVAVQKARTAEFFSDNKHAFSARAIGFLSQRFFPAGIDGGLRGPLFHVQNELSIGQPGFGIPNHAATTPLLDKKNPLRNGITIFPGGAPLYKNGQFVGAIGISGDGVDQDDIATFAGTKNFQPDPKIRSDHLSEEKIVNFMTNRLNQMATLFNMDPDVINGSLNNLKLGLDGVQLPYIKFPRNPEI
jgi:uncharacterized protein GlcG (DUF336 family)